MFEQWCYKSLLLKIKVTLILEQLSHVNKYFEIEEEEFGWSGTYIPKLNTAINSAFLLILVAVKLITYKHIIHSISKYVRNGIAVFYVNIC